MGDIRQELSAVKDWIRNRGRYTDNQAPASDESIRAEANKLVAQAKSVSSVIDSLLHRIKALADENALLHKRLQAAENNEVTTSPGYQREEWRHNPV